MWDEGFGAGMMGDDWVEVVAGRFLKSWQRRKLASGWRAGLQELDRMEDEMRRHAEFEASVEWERIGPVGDDIPL